MVLPASSVGHDNQLTSLALSRDANFLVADSAGTCWYLLLLNSMIDRKKLSGKDVLHTEFHAFALKHVETSLL